MESKNTETIKKEVEERIKKIKKTDKVKYNRLKKITKKDNWIDKTDIKDMMSIFKSLKYMDKETLEYYQNGIKKVNDIIGGKNE